ncbi:imidazolonepropionase [Shewanella avicenniae]|uniref:Imidazolonepropionase n=1 Tax=Shewanella avicenniae TaxID=2814294 RepID=A0ABX7QVP4_9GAMM|nr:imidazolonepropionase [Shewanella avicenniae]QSX35567.1 imidazolonepropionase [Shewanella avicenniae]
MKVDKIWFNCRVATLANPAEPLAVTDNAAIAMRDGKIVALDSSERLLAAYQAERVVDLQGRLVTPGLIDCHTHLVYAGNRAHEFELRLAGANYADIANAGGGIASTLKATRAASADELLQQSLPRLDRLLAEGVTTVEVKSGYGQSLESELKQLEVARELSSHRLVSISPTLLAAHVVPPEYKADPEGYVSFVCDELIPAAIAAGKVDAIDGFCEHIAFTPPQIARIFSSAKQRGIAVKLHAAQLSNDGGVQVAAQYRALSADHLEYADDAAVAAMAASGTVAVLLPGAFYCLREQQRPPVALLRQYGVPIAVATDANPGTSPLTSPQLAMHFACTLFGLTVAEAFSGMTIHAAKALGQATEIGSLEVGKYCDLAIWDAERPAEIIYQMGFNPLYRRVWRGHEST